MNFYRVYLKNQGNVVRGEGKNGQGIEIEFIWFNPDSLLLIHERLDQRGRQEIVFYSPNSIPGDSTFIPHLIFPMQIKTLGQILLDNKKEFQNEIEKREGKEEKVLIKKPRKKV